MADDAYRGELSELLEDLVTSPGISGDESAIRDTIAGYVENDVDDMYVDGMGNLITRKGAGDKKLMVMAHMDQIGFRTKYVRDDGYVRVSNVGGINDIAVPHQHVSFYNTDDEVAGSLPTKPPHLMENEEKSQTQGTEDLFVDVGAETGDDVRDHGIDIGSEAIYAPVYEEHLNNYVVGPALDNRIGCAAAIEALKRFDDSMNYELYTVFTAQEEVGTKGAKAAARGVEPDAALAVDTAVAGDHPRMEPVNDTHVQTGEGPVITIQEANGRGLITAKHVEEWMENTAENNQLPYQKEVGEGGATDAAGIYHALEGIPSGSVGIPTRNIHSPVESARLDDLSETINYLEGLYESFPGLKV